MSMLEVKNLTKHFGGVKAVDGATFKVEAGTITALIGPNGAGKTTVFNLITGLISADKGSVVFRGEYLSDHKPHEIYHLGIARTYQLLRIFPELTAEENLMIAHRGQHEGLFDVFHKPKYVKAEEKAKRERAHEYLKMVGLYDKRHYKAGSLSYGQQKLLDIARCLATEADLIMLDEPVAGVNPRLREKISDLLLTLKKKGRTVLLIEHDMSFVMGMSDTVIVLERGKEIAVGTPKQIKNNKKVIRAYLGEKKK